MNGFTEHQASGASETPGRRDMILTWATAQDMLPLVGHILRDITTARQQLAKLYPEKEGLDRRRHKLEWPERSRRYQLDELIAREEGALATARDELYHLGLTMVEEGEGLVGFPTIVNNKKAYFSWRQGEEGIEYWHFAEDHNRRTVPAAWKEPNDKVKVARKK